MRHLNSLAYLILLGFLTLSQYTKIDYYLPIMYLVLGYILAYEYSIYHKDEKELNYLIHPRIRIKQELLSILYLGTFIVTFYYLDKLNYLTIREIKPQERLLQLLFLGIIIIKGFLFSDYQSGYKLMTSGFKNIGLNSEKYSWELLTKFEIDYERLTVKLIFKNNKTIKILLNKEYNQKEILDIENYLKEKSKNVA